jgi:hypothetical protein
MVIGVINQLSYRLGAPHCSLLFKAYPIFVGLFGTGWFDDFPSQKPAAKSFGEFPAIAT